MSWQSPLTGTALDETFDVFPYAQAVRGISSDRDARTSYASKIKESDFSNAGLVKFMLHSVTLDL